VFSRARRRFDERAPLLVVVGAVVVFPVAAAAQLPTQELLSRAPQSLTASATA
jgi:hypothetical protein